MEETSQKLFKNSRQEDKKCMNQDSEDMTLEINGLKNAKPTENTAVEL